MGTQQRPGGCLSIRHSCSPGRPGTLSSLRDLRRHPGHLGSTKGRQSDKEPHPSFAEDIGELVVPMTTVVQPSMQTWGSDRTWPLVYPDDDPSPRQQPRPQGCTAPEGKQSPHPGTRDVLPTGMGGHGVPGTQPLRWPLLMPALHGVVPGTRASPRNPSPSQHATLCPPRLGRGLSSARHRPTTPSLGAQHLPCAGREGKAIEWEHKGSERSLQPVWPRPSPASEACSQRQ